VAEIHAKSLADPEDFSPALTTWNTIVIEGLIRTRDGKEPSPQRVRTWISQAYELELLSRPGKPRKTTPKEKN
jgi:hypothetical protein